MSGTPVVLGIDPGTNCGWAVLDVTSGARIASGTWDLKPRRHEGGGMRYVRLDRLFGELLASYAVQGIGYEEVRRHMGVDAAHVYGGIIASLGAACERAKITTYQGIPVGTIKKVATGKGNADKAVMMSAAAARWPGVQLTGDDEADALWCAEVWRVQNLLSRAA